MGYSNEPEWTPWGAVNAAVSLVDSFADVFRYEKDQLFVGIVKLFLYLSILPILILVLVVLSYLKHLFLKNR